ncbi:MAG: four helix bundle protein [Bacteroidetes bacterium]|nr:four helix bundle protein [Bacteroidota bacterium]
MNNRIKFRFQDLEIWKESIRMAEFLLDIADELERRKLFRFSDQLRGSALSISNNIAEGSGSSSKKVFARYLDMARSSVYENANILIVLNRRNLVSARKREVLMNDLETLSRRITTFRKTLM